MRQDKEREAEFQPKRIEYAIQQLEKLGIHIMYQDNTKIQFQHLGKKVTLFPYSGWHSGTTIKDGRGIELLLIQLRNTMNV
jgi:hypothetical protein